MTWVRLNSDLRGYIHKLIELPWIPIICLIGIVLRFSGLTSSPLWYDEIFSLTATRFNFIQMIDKLQVNLNPPGWEILLWPITHIFGRNLISSHLIPFLASIALIWASYELTKKYQLTDQQTIAAMILICFIPNQIALAQEGRSYALLCLLYVLGIIWALEGKLIQLSIVIIFMVWLHNIAVVYAITLILIFIFLHPRRWWSLFVASAIMFLSYLPRFPVLIEQSGEGIAWFLPLTIDSIMIALGDVIFAWSLRWKWQFYVIGLILFLLGIVLILPSLHWIIFRMRKEYSKNILFGQIIKRSPIFWLPASEDRINLLKFRITLIIAAIMPIIFLFIVMAVLHQNFIYARTISPLVSPLSILLSMLFLPKRLRARNLVTMFAWLLILLTALLGWSPSEKGGNIEAVTEMIREQWQPGDIIYHGSGVSSLIFWHYLSEKPQYMLRDGFLSGDIELFELDIPAMKLDTIAYKRAWVIWWSDKNIKSLLTKQDQKIFKLVKNCSLASVIYTKKLAPIKVFLCKNKG